MDRKELYKDIISLNLQEEIKSVFGKNFTQVSNEKLQEFLNKTHCSIKEALEPGNKPEDTWVNNPVVTLVNILHKKRILLDSEVKEILG